MTELLRNSEKETIVIKAKAEKNDEVLAYVDSVLRSRNVCETKIRKVMLAVGEIFANVASYAYEEPGELRIEIYAVNDMVYIKFIDAGYAYNPLKKDMPDISMDVASRQIGGLGIYITKQVVDFIDYKRHNNLNVLTIGIRKDE